MVLKFPLHSENSPTFSFCSVVLAFQLNNQVQPLTQPFPPNGHTLTLISLWLEDPPSPTVPPMNEVNLLHSQCEGWPEYNPETLRSKKVDFRYHIEVGGIKDVL